MRFDIRLTQVLDLDYGWYCGTNILGVGSGGFCDRDQKPVARLNRTSDLSSHVDLFHPFPGSTRPAKPHSNTRREEHRAARGSLPTSCAVAGSVSRDA
jgi:hypothetical protein